LGVAIWLAGLALAPASLLAQAAPPAGSDTPATDAVGPRELQNFSLSGTVTRPAEPQPVPRSRAVQPPGNQTAEPPAPATPKPQSTARRAQTSEQARPTSVASTQAAPAPPAASPSAAALPALTTPAAASPPPVSLRPELAGAPLPLDAEHRLLLWPWLLAAFVAAAAAAFLFWRNRSRHAFAGGPDVDLFVAPEPAPGPKAPQPAARAPQPAPQQQPAPAPAPPKDPLTAGLVTSSLRANMEIAVHPSRCVLTDDSVTIEFELEVFNSGNSPARAIAIEGIMLNAGAEQEQDLGAFFARAAVAGNRIDVIQPISRMTFPTQVVMPREAMQPIEMGGRDVFVPLLAFNAIYRSGSIEGQTSASFLVGRDGSGDKLGPFPLNLGPRIFRGLGARALPLGVRR
jgi:hypothetical protein